MVEWSMHVGEPCRQILEGHFSSTPFNLATPSSGDLSPNQSTKNSNMNNNNVINNSNLDPRSTRRPPSTQNELLVLCDKALFLLKAETGALIQQRRLERADASCICAVPASLGGLQGGGSSGNFLLAGQDATVQVYAGFNLGKHFGLPLFACLVVVYLHVLYCVFSWI